MKTIAIIDDDIHIGNMLTEVLEREGYGVLRAYSGTEALLLLEQKQPDLVLLDLMLPGLAVKRFFQDKRDSGHGGQRKGGRGRQGRAASWGSRGLCDETF